MNVKIEEIEMNFSTNEMNALRNAFGKTEAEPPENYSSDINTPGQVQQLLASVNIALRNNELDRNTRVKLLKIRRNLKRVIDGIYKVEY
jgi:hypothetical protein